MFIRGVLELFYIADEEDDDEDLRYQSIELRCDAYNDLVIEDICQNSEIMSVAINSRGGIDLDFAKSDSDGIRVKITGKDQEYSTIKREYPWGSELKEGVSKETLFEELAKFAYAHDNSKLIYWKI